MGIGMPGAMAAVARPGILARVGHHRGPHRVGLDAPQNDEQVVAVLDDRGSEAALPDVAAGSLSPVVPPGVSDRLPWGPSSLGSVFLGVWGPSSLGSDRFRISCGENSKSV